MYKNFLIFIFFLKDKESFMEKSLEIKYRWIFVIEIYKIKDVG